MKAYVFPGQASQFPGMGKDLYDQSETARDGFEQANDLLGFRISDVMFNGTEEELKETRVTQPAVFLHSVLTARLAGERFQPEAVAGHSLGEFSALVAAGALSFEDGLELVRRRAEAMQRACEARPGTMAAIIGMEDEQIEQLCAEATHEVVPANYNTNGQLVISGTIAGVEAVVEAAKAAGARMAVLLPVGGAFHSPLMQPAQEELTAALEQTNFSAPVCPIYQNVNAEAQTDPETIRKNLIAQLTSPVRWTQTIQQMLADGVTEFVEVGGNGKTLRGMIKRIDRRVASSALAAFE